MRENLFQSANEQKCINTINANYISITVKKSQVKSRLYFLLGFFFRAFIPGKRDDLGIIVPGLFPEDRSYEESQVCPIFFFFVSSFFIVFKVQD